MQKNIRVETGESMRIRLPADNLVDKLLLEGKIDQKFADSNRVALDEFDKKLERTMKEIFAPLEIGISDIK